MAQIANCSWDAVNNAQGYNVYLKGAPDNYFMKFNGVDQYVDIGCNSFAAEGALFSVEFDFISNTTNSGFLFGVSDSLSSYLFRIHINRNSIEGNEAGKMCIQLRSYDGQQRRLGFLNAATFNDGNKHHFAVTVNVDTIKCYLDGSEVSLELSSFSNWAESLSTGTWQSSDDSIFIGAGNNVGSAGGHVECQIANLRLWTSERTASEVSNNMDSYLDGSDADLYANYIMDEKFGNVIIDNAGLNDGTLVGNVNDNMWEIDPDSPATTEFKKQNKSLIQTTNFTIEELGTGSHESYATSQVDNEESTPSNVVAFTV